MIMEKLRQVTARQNRGRKLIASRAFDNYDTTKLTPFNSFLSASGDWDFEQCNCDCNTRHTLSSGLIAMAQLDLDRLPHSHFDSGLESHVDDASDGIVLATTEYLRLWARQVAQIINITSAFITIYKSINSFANCLTLALLITLLSTSYVPISHFMMAERKISCIELLSENNFETWKIDICVKIRIENCGTTIRNHMPEITTGAAVHKWNKCAMRATDAMALWGNWVWNSDIHGVRKQIKKTITSLTLQTIIVARLHLVQKGCIGLLRG